MMRRRTLAVAVLLVCSFGGFDARADCPPLVGDIDGSGAVSVVDVQCGLITLLWSLSGEQGPPPTCAEGGPDSLDINCSATGDLVDVTLLIQISLQIPLSPLVDADENGCPDGCEQQGAAMQLQYFGDERFESGPLVLSNGNVVYASAGLDVTAQTWPASADHEVTLFYRSQGSGTFQAVPMALVSTTAGPYGTNASWHAQLGTTQLDSISLLELYLAATDGTSTLFASNGGTNFGFPINASGGQDPLDFVGGQAFFASSLPRANGDPLFAGVDLQVTVQTWPPSLDHQVTLFYSTDGQQLIHEVPMEFERAGAGPFGNNFEWSALIPASMLPSGGTLELWMAATNGTKTLYDSNSGANYELPIQDPNDAFSVTYARPGKYIFNKCHWDGQNCFTGWKYSGTVGNPISATYSQYQVYGSWTHPAVEIYLPGISDGAPGDPLVKFAVENLLGVRVTSALFSGSPSAAEGHRALPLTDKVGNNFVFQWMYLATGCTCPVGFSWPQKAMYSYRYEVTLDGGLTWTEIPLDMAGSGSLPLQVDWQLAPL